VSALVVVVNSSAFLPLALLQTQKLVLKQHLLFCFDQMGKPDTQHSSATIKSIEYENTTVQVKREDEQQHTAEDIVAGSDSVLIVVLKNPGATSGIQVKREEDEHTAGDMAVAPAGSSADPVIVSNHGGIEINKGDNAAFFAHVQEQLPLPAVCVQEQLPVPEVCGSDSVIVLLSNDGGIENNKGDDAASAHVQEQFPLPAVCARSESNVQHPPLPVKTPSKTEITSSIPEKNKRKTSGNDPSETAMRKKKRTISTHTKLVQREAFENRCRELTAFKDLFGHCNVPQAYAANKSLGHWCHSIRVAYKHVQQGMSTSYNLSKDRMERLEEIGFQWQITDFNTRCIELMAFKEEFGHCNVTTRFPANPSLGRWCSTLRGAYRKIQKGMETKTNLSQDRIARLEAIGFQWQITGYDKRIAKPRNYSQLFDKRCFELETFKEEFGHCNVPQTYPANLVLGGWCHRMRAAYNNIQKGMKTTRNLSQERIVRLEGIGFQWKLSDHDEGFERRCFELETFKEEFGHVRVPKRFANNISLARWCSDTRAAYRKIQKGVKPNTNLSQDRIDRLNKIGFKWEMIDYDEGFEKRCFELETFKEEFGHCKVPQRYAGNPPLGKWCNHLRTAYRKIKNGIKPNINLSQDRISQLERIGFSW